MLRSSYETVLTRWFATSQAPAHASSREHPEGRETTGQPHGPFAEIVTMGDDLRGNGKRS
jgi:hypothetical protein